MLISVERAQKHRHNEAIFPARDQKTQWLWRRKASLSLHFSETQQNKRSFASDAADCERQAGTGIGK